MAERSFAHEVGKLRMGQGQEFRGEGILAVTETRPGQTDVPLYVLNVTYPLLDEEIIEFCRGKRAVMMVEEEPPEYIEQALNTILRNADVAENIANHGRNRFAA